MQAKITKQHLNTLRPKAKMYAVRDTELKGFVLRVRPNGGMTWFFDYRNAEGRRLNYRIGAYPGLEPEGARKLAKTAAGKIAGHIDVQAVKKEARLEAARSKVSTLGAFIEDKYAPWALQEMKRGATAVTRLLSDFEHWLNEPLMSFNSWRIESFRTDRKKAGVKATTINRQLDTLRGCLRKAVDWKVILSHPMEDVKWLKGEDSKRVRYLSPDEEKRLRAAMIDREADMRDSRDRYIEWLKHHTAPSRERVAPIPPGYADHLQPIVLVAMNTGLRRGELFSLLWSDIDYFAKMLTVRAAASKNQDSRRIPLNAEALKVLRAWQRQQKGELDELVFPGEDGARLNNINKSWATLRTRAKLIDFRFHDLRHHFASRLVQSGVDLNTVRELLGHKNLTMTIRYSHLAPGNLSAAVAKLTPVTPRRQRGARPKPTTEARWVRAA